MRNAVVRARVEEDLKNKASEVFKTVGLSTSDAIHLFLKQTVLTQALPFPVSVPNATTKRAMQEVRDRKNLIYPEPGKSIFDDLHSDDEE
jgi:DNA-damage-inducible protein J